MAFHHPTGTKLNLSSTQSPTQQITPPPTGDDNRMSARSAFSIQFDPSTNNHDREDSDDEQEEGEHEDDSPNLSSIHLRVNVPLAITGDNNLIAIEPSQSASKIAVAIVSAMKSMTMGSSGVPMIDEEGRPRPILVEVNADVKIDGSKNVVGERAVVGHLPQNGGMRRRPEERKTEENGLVQVAKKRERAGSEPMEMESKRTRRD